MTNTFTCNGCKGRLISSKPLHGAIHDGCRRFGVWVQAGRVLAPVVTAPKAEPVVEKPLRARKPKRIVERPTHPKCQPKLKPLVEYRIGDRVIVSYHKSIREPGDPDAFEAVIVNMGRSAGQWKVKSERGTEWVHNQFISRKGE